MIVLRSDKQQQGNAAALTAGGARGRAGAAPPPPRSSQASCGQRGGEAGVAGRRGLTEVQELLHGERRGGEARVEVHLLRDAARGGAAQQGAQQPHGAALVPPLSSAQPGPTAISRPASSRGPCPGRGLLRLAAGRRCPKGWVSPPGPAPRSGDGAEERAAPRERGGGAPGAARPPWAGSQPVRRPFRCPCVSAVRREKAAVASRRSPASDRYGGVTYRGGCRRITGEGLRGAHQPPGREAARRPEAAAPRRRGGGCEGAGGGGRDRGDRAACALPQRGRKVPTHQCRHSAVEGLSERLARVR